MKLKTVATAFIGISVLAVGAASFSRFTLRRAIQSEPSRVTLEWRAKQARSQGKQEMSFDAGTNSYAQPRTLREALQYYDVIVAEPVSKRSFAEDNHEFIKTWYQ